jgi:ferredoxin-nitrite reductase
MTVTCAAPVAPHPASDCPLTHSPAPSPLQVGDIGLMGAPAKVGGKAQEGFKLFLGGKIGENPELAKEFGQGVPAATEHLVPRLAEVLVAEFGAKPKAAAA